MLVMTGFRATGDEKWGEGEGEIKGDFGGMLRWGQDVREVHLAMKLKRKCNAIQGK